MELDRLNSELDVVWVNNRAEPDRLAGTESWALLTVPLPADARAGPRRVHRERDGGPAVQGGSSQGAAVKSF